MSGNLPKYPAGEGLVPVEERVVEFYGDELVAVLVMTEARSAIYVPLKPIADNIGLDWPAQYRRVQRDPILSEASQLIAVGAIKSRRGNPTELCLPLEFLPSFLYGISVNRLTNPQALTRLVLYQNELAAHIADAFFDVLRPEIRAAASDLLQLSTDADPQSLRDTLIGLGRMLGAPLVLPTADPRRAWHVYIAKLVTLYKIGYSRDVDARMKELRRAGGAARLEVELFHWFPTDHPSKAERLLHERYAHKRKNGEWFRLTEADTKALTTIVGFANGKFIPKVS